VHTSSLSCCDLCAGGASLLGALQAAGPISAAAGGGVSRVCHLLHHQRGALAPAMAGHADRRTGPRADAARQQARDAVCAAGVEDRGRAGGQGTGAGAGSQGAGSTLYM
jgi:hypothetical protein